MGYLATGEIFENVLQLKRFGLYFEGIMNMKIDTIARVRKHAPRKFFKMIDGFW